MPKKQTKIEDGVTLENPRAILRSFRDKTQEAMQKINDVQGFRNSDTMVDYVFKIGRELFDTPLDQHNTGKLIRDGGRLTGVYAYLGQQSAYARAQRDVFQQKATEVEKERLIAHMRAGTKITEARAKVQLEITELNELVIEKEIGKNQWENITDAVEKMVSFIQSAIKVKEGERFQNSHALRDNQG